MVAVVEQSTAAMHVAGSITARYKYFCDLNFVLLGLAEKYVHLWLYRIAPKIIDTLKAYHDDNVGTQLASSLCTVRLVIRILSH